MLSSSSYDPTCFTIFISCSAGKRPELKSFAKHFQRKKGLNVWLPEASNEQQADDRFQEGIKVSDLAIIGISDSYLKSPRCRKEAEYAVKQNRAIFPVKMEPSCQLEGFWLDQLFQQSKRLVPELFDFDKSTIDFLAEEAFTQMFSEFVEKNRNKFRLIGVSAEQYLAKRHYLQLDFEPKLSAIEKIQDGGLLVVSGDEGVGKTCLMSLLFLEPKYHAFLQNQCKIGTVLWLNCYPWHDEKTFADRKNDLKVDLLELVASATKRGRSLSFQEHVRILIDSFKSPPLFVFDDVFHFELLDFLRQECKSLPCVVITRTHFLRTMQSQVCLEEREVNASLDLNVIAISPRPVSVLQQMRTEPTIMPEYSDLKVSKTHWEVVVDLVEIVEPWPNKAIQMLLRDILGVKARADQLRRMADDSCGLPRLAVSMAKAFKHGSLGITFGRLDSKSGLIVDAIAQKRCQSATPRDGFDAVLPQLRLLNVPEVCKDYYIRQDEENTLRRSLWALSNKENPTSGIFVMEGSAGIGKTTLVAHLLRDPKHNVFFQKQCNFQIVIWLNCYQWKDGFDEEGRANFLKKLLNLGEQADLDFEDNFKNLTEMTEHFSLKKSLRILFVFDDVYHHSILEAFCNECPYSTLCCAITRSSSYLTTLTFDPFIKYLKFQGNFLANPYQIPHLSERKAVEVLQGMFKLKGKFNEEQLIELAKRSLGIPLLLTFIGCWLGNCRNLWLEYQKIVKLDFHRTTQPERFAHALLVQALTSLWFKERQRFYAFLFFDPNEAVDEKYLQVMWQCDDADEVSELCLVWEKLSLIRNIPKVGGRSYFLHEAVHYAAVDIALRDHHVQIHGRNNLFQLRGHLLREQGLLDVLKRAEGYVVSLLSHIDDESFRFLRDSSEGEGRKLTVVEWQTILTEAAGLGHSFIVNHLIANGVSLNEVDAKGKTALMTAAKGGHVKVAERLLNGGANISATDRNGNTALMMAALMNRDKMAELLSAKGASVNVADQNGQTALMGASFWGHLKMVEFLVSKGATIDVCDKSGQTALMYATQRGYEKIVAFLLSKGAQVNSVDQNGSSALIQAAANNNVPIVELLLMYGADIDFTDQSGQNALMKASQCGGDKIVQLLIRRAAIVDAFDENGQTALMMAAAGGYLNVAELLIKKGRANLEMVDSSGQTASTLATSRGHTNLVQLLSVATPRTM